MTTVLPSRVDVQGLSELLAEPDGGFTIDVRTGARVNCGYAVSIFPQFSTELPLADATPAVIGEYIERHAAVLHNPFNRLGGWHDPETGRVWLDISLVLASRNEAIRWAEASNQIAIFDLANFVSIPTGGTGRTEGN